MKGGDLDLHEFGTWNHEKVGRPWLWSCKNCIMHALWVWGSFCTNLWGCGLWSGSHSHGYDRSLERWGDGCRDWIGQRYLGWERERAVWTVNERSKLWNSISQKWAFVDPSSDSDLGLSLSLSHMTSFTSSQKIKVNG